MCDLAGTGGQEIAVPAGRAASDCQNELGPALAAGETAERSRRWPRPSPSRPPRPSTSPRSRPGSSTTCSASATCPTHAYWGVHTLRAVENFPITGVPVGHFPELVRALAMVKQAAARANRRLGHLPRDKAEAIDRACDAIIARPAFHDQFVVDAIQGGAGTSTNMNANEVIANVALGAHGPRQGDYAALHPNDDVNMAQSTNDAYPTALRLAVIFATEPLIQALDELAYALKDKAVEFADVLKMGRTQLQDAVPMTLGPGVRRLPRHHEGGHRPAARELVGLFREVNLGATAIGTGINADPRYAALAVEELSRDRGPADGAGHEPDRGDLGHGRLRLVLGRAEADRGQALEDLQRPAPALQRAARRASARSACRRCRPAPRSCRARSTRSSRRWSNQVAFLVIGHDLTVTLCAEGGQLQLNAFEPTIGYCLPAVDAHADRRPSTR